MSIKQKSTSDEPFSCSYCLNSLTQESSSPFFFYVKPNSPAMDSGSGEGASLPSTGPDAQKRRVSYFYEPAVGVYYYVHGHPMKPHRVSMAHSLIVS